MPQKPAIEGLPEEVRRWLEQALVDQNFSNYKLLETLLCEKGFEIGKSSIHRFGKKLEKRLSAIKASTEAARLVVESASDDKNARSEAVMALVQSELFDTLVNLSESEEETDPAKRVVLLSNAAHAVANVARADITQKKFRHEVQQRIEAAAASVENIARKGGLSQESVEALRREILGIAA
ncbi:MAG: DUF3486 family protein [Proteobacteria bacterium]|nr:DUF3486 family protein [Pseudomonadota bacterium]